MFAPGASTASHQQKRQPAPIRSIDASRTIIVEPAADAQKEKFRPIDSANGMAKRQRVQDDGREHDRDKNLMDNPFSRDGQDGANDQDWYSTHMVNHPQGITECDRTE